MSRSLKKYVDDAAVAQGDQALSRLLAEMIGLRGMFAGQSVCLLVQGGQAANDSGRPADLACDDLFDNVPV